MLLMTRLEGACGSSGGTPDSMLEVDTGPLPRSVDANKEKV